MEQIRQILETELKAQELIGNARKRAELIRQEVETQGNEYIKMALAQAHEEVEKYAQSLNNALADHQRRLSETQAETTRYYNTLFEEKKDPLSQMVLQEFIRSLKEE